MATKHSGSSLSTSLDVERVRRDFVANVSHELRTPVQLVKGFAESLLDGALADAEQAKRSKKVKTLFNKAAVEIAKQETYRRRRDFSLGASQVTPP